MTDSMLGPVAAARWFLPLRTPGDQATEDRVESGVIEASLTLAAAPIQTQRFSPLSLNEPADLGDDIFRQAGPELQFGDAEGRAAVGSALARP